MQQSSRRTLPAVFLSVVLVIGSAVLVKYAFRGYDAYSAARETRKLYAFRPSPEHSPADVVRFQLAALSQVDKPHPGAGMELVYAFLSPDQRETIGSLEQLASLFTQPPFRDLIRFDSARLDETLVTGNHARQLVFIRTPDQRVAAFAFLLTRQEEGVFAESWMTAAVLPMQIQVGTGPPPYLQADPNAAAKPIPEE